MTNQNLCFCGDKREIINLAILGLCMYLSCYVYTAMPKISADPLQTPQNVPSEGSSLFATHSAGFF